MRSNISKECPNDMVIKLILTQNPSIMHISVRLVGMCQLTDEKGKYYSTLLQILHNLLL